MQKAFSEPPDPIPDGSEPPPPKKRRAGRPPKQETLSNKKETLTLGLGQVSSKMRHPVMKTRSAGRMSLRPNRRVNVKLGLDEEDPLGDDDDRAAVHDIAEVLDGDFSDDFVPQANIPPDDVADDDDEMGDTSMDATDTSIDEGTPNRKGQRRRIMFTKLLERSPKKGQIDVDDEGSQDEPEELPKDQICAICTRELSASREPISLFSDTTDGGKSLYELFYTLTKERVSSEYFGSYLCHRCYQSLNNIENNYVQYRKSCETFLDTFTAAQRTLDADMGRGITSDIGMASFVDVSSTVFRILPDDISPVINPGSIEADLQTLSNVKGAIVHAGEMPTDEELASSQKTDNVDGVITLTFDVETGSLEKTTSDDFNLEVESSDIDNTAVRVFLTKSEWDTLVKAPVPGKKVFVSIDEFDKIAGGLIIGYFNLSHVILSKSLFEEFCRQMAVEERCKYICADCAAPFPYFNMLSNHIDSVHRSSEQNTLEPREIVGKVGTMKNLERTGETPTLEKPFQCEHCDKCFADYSNMATHVDHYHGFRRKCNIEGCEETLTTIQDFARHYVSHRDKSLAENWPTEFKDKQKIMLPCPVCTYRIQGIWKFFHHTFTHDKEPRFKCPICPKRMTKVQNFRDHLLRHKGPQFKNKKCQLCDKEFYPQDLYRHMKQVHQTTDPANQLYKCGECDKTFAAKHKLRYHQDMHLPNEQWTHQCSKCMQKFPSQQRLKAHMTNVHTTSSYCQLCNKTFLNKYTLSTHMRQHHSFQELALFECSHCNKREPTLVGARKHFRLDHKDKPFQCNLCKAILARETDLHKHLSENHSEYVGTGPLGNADNPDYPCIVCNKLFSKETTRLRHVRFIHLVESTDVGDMMQSEEGIVLETDQIIEYDEMGQVTRLHSIP